MYQHIKQSIQDGIAQIVMDRPASNNALDAQMFRDLIAAVEQRTDGRRGEELRLRHAHLL